MNFLEDLEDLIEWIGNLLDANSDGVVNVDDLFVEANNAVEAVTDFVDTDANGIINFRDAKSKLFDYLDQNNSGAVESEEFHQRVQELILSLYDKDGNGQINSFDILLRNLATEIGENFGPLAKFAFKSSLKHFM